MARKKGGLGQAVPVEQPEDLLDSIFGAGTLRALRVRTPPPAPAKDAGKGKEKRMDKYFLIDRDLAKALKLYAVQNDMKKLPSLKPPYGRFWARPTTEHSQLVKGWKRCAFSTDMRQSVVTMPKRHGDAINATASQTETLFVMSVASTQTVTGRTNTSRRKRNSRNTKGSCAASSMPQARNTWIKSCASSVCSAEVRCDLKHRRRLRRSPCKDARCILVGRTRVRIASLKLSNMA